MKLTLCKFLEKFRRITSGGSYIPEIDGLRFIAIFWVVALMHTSNFINVKVYNKSFLSSYISSAIIEGGYGVSLFFMISGFILALPFARQQLQNGPKVSLKTYYLRRITRLEPPYLAALLIAFTGLVFILKKFSFSELLPHLAASSVYAHGLIYNGEKSWVLGVAWSLEVEVQFYILCPLLVFLYRIKKTFLRYFIFSVLIIVFTIHAYNNFWTGYPGIQYSLHCFLIGMFICDLYLNEVKLNDNINFWFILGIVLFLCLPLLISIYNLLFYLLKHLLIGLLFYIGISNIKMKKLLSVQIISIIGGMCYSIYLVHFMIMTSLLPLLQKIKIYNQIWQFCIYFILIIVSVLVGGSIFYKVVEQPCMNKNWYKFKPAGNRVAKKRLIRRLFKQTL